MPNYCSNGDVSAFLQVSNFTGDTTPQADTVDAFIEMAEARVEQLTDHAWHTNNALEVTEERGRVQRVVTNALTNTGRIQLKHYPVVAFTQHATTQNFAQTNGNLKVWNGSGYVEYLDSDLATMGTITDVTNKDFWLDAQRGIIYIDKFNIFSEISDAPAGVDAYISYKYATATTPKDIKLATIYFTASTIAANDDLNLMAEGDDSMDNATKSQKFEEMAMKILKDNKRMGRNITMARAIGGFGTGKVYP
tara:strand:+ start:41 stop:790 length:750 start_codon:yes stop_codon:yes gene_type:complete